jgi:hypothetical protein
MRGKNQKTSLREKMMRKKIIQYVRKIFNYPGSLDKPNSVTLLKKADDHLSNAAYPEVRPLTGNHEAGFFVLYSRILPYLALLQAGFIQFRCFHYRFR